ncbi:MAG: glycosyltransferase family 9 protein, partial [Pseudomonadota bacterium]
MATIEDACLMAVAQELSGRWDLAESTLRQILTHVPEHPLTSFLYATQLLARGDYLAAWPHFLRRVGMEFYLKKATTQLPRPYWDGRPRPDATVLIHTDQGLGDLIMCARYMPLVADRVGRAIFVVHEGTRRLFSTIDRRLEILELGDPMPAFDYHLHAFSLPAVFRTIPATIPPATCLRAEEPLVGLWRRRLGAGFKVGLCWQGNPAHQRDAARSIPLRLLEPVLRVPGVRFFALQPPPGDRQLADLPSDIEVEDLSSALADPDVMVPAAAIIECLDLVISIDSGLAHLAGALGAPVWIALPFVADWRWMRTGDVSPWYPT